MRETSLIVDDEPTIIDITKRYLEKENLNVITANNGKAPFDICQEPRAGQIVQTNTWSRALYQNPLA
ncbi:response regulator [Bacillus cereus]|uniref:response regulator n=1 Tax=Bacillus cereus TaxID=1396 RepID=UPI000BEE7796|nr:response regulator [Bacillus cereus]PEF61866.1 hypothetical protein CON35_23050 [Bacillus cereus]